jgi:hypothetical protein
MIDLRSLVGDEWAEWYVLTPAQRLEESSKLWQTYLELGGSLDPERRGALCPARTGP